MDNLKIRSLNTVQKAGCWIFWQKKDWAANGPEDITYQLIQTGEGQLTVEPWPFEEKTFEANFESRLIPQLTFKSASKFKDRFREARVTEGRWRFEKKH